MHIKSGLPALLAAALLLTFAGCRKVKYERDPTAYYPKVSTDSFRVQPDGSVTLMGSVLSAGSGEIYYAGFCMDTAPDPEMHINQQLAAAMSGDRFEAVYSNLDAQKTYYARSFAVNEFGFAYGKSLRIEKPSLDTSTIPCHPGANMITVDLGWTTKTESLSYREKLDEYDETNASSTPSYYGLRLRFARKPITGKYTIWHNPPNNAPYVEVWFREPNTGTFEMDNGGTVYVQQIDASRIRVWLCQQRCGDRIVTASFETD